MNGSKLDTHLVIYNKRSGTDFYLLEALDAHFSFIELFPRLFDGSLAVCNAA